MLPLSKGVWLCIFCYVRYYTHINAIARYCLQLVGLVNSLSLALARPHTVENIEN